MLVMFSGLKLYLRTYNPVAAETRFFVTLPMSMPAQKRTQSDRFEQNKRANNSLPGQPRRRRDRRLRQRDKIEKQNVPTEQTCIIGQNHIQNRYPYFFTIRQVEEN